MTTDSLSLLIEFISGKVPWDHAVLDALLELGRLSAIRAAEYPAPPFTRRVGPPANPMPLSHILLEDLKQLSEEGYDPSSIRWSILGDWVGQTLSQQSQVVQQ